MCCVGFFAAMPMFLVGQLSELLRSPCCAVPICSCLGPCILCADCCTCLSVCLFLFRCCIFVVVWVVWCCCCGRRWGGRWECLILLNLWSWCWAIKHIVLLVVRARSPMSVVLAVVPVVVLPYVALFVLVFAFSVSLLPFLFLCERLWEDIG